MRQQEAEFEQLGVQIVIVTFQSGPMAEAYVRESKLSWPLLIDDSLQLYKSYGMERGRWQDIFGLESIASYAKLMMRGRKPRMPAGDPYQLGGDVLIDPRGIVRLHHVGNGPADRPSVESILKIVRDADQQS